MATEHWPTFVLLAVYVFGMIIVTTIANIKNRRNLQNHRESISGSYSIQNPYASHISTHFLAAKDFGVIVLTLTSFASIFSGYTVVGTPNVAGEDGWTAIKWLTCGLAVSISMLIVFPRIRRLSINRNYESPGDFINDRYNSKALCGFITLSLCIPQFLYLAVQIYSIGETVSNLTDNQLSFYAVISVSTILILIFEAFGGMRSVAYTDVIQATVMILVFLTIPIVITVLYGGFIGQVVSTKDLPCYNSSDLSDNERTGCLNYATKDIANEYFLRTPSSLSIINYTLFNLSLFSFPINPHVLQRAFTARHDWQVRFVVGIMFIASFVAQIPGVLLGITYISNQLSFKKEYQSMGAFQAMLAVFRDQGGFVGFLSYIALLAAIAGIMSTADSCLIGVSNTVSCDIFKNWLTPHVTQTQTVWIGKLISIFTMVIAILMAVYIQETQMKYDVILVLQQGILWQALPAYMFGLYTNVGTKSILLGVIAGLVLDALFVGLVFSDNDPFEAADPALAGLDKSWSAFIGVGANLCCIAVGHFVFKWMDKPDIQRIIITEVTDEREKTESDNDQLSIDKIRNIMDGRKEPMTKCYGLPVLLSGVFVLISGVHWIGEIDPQLIEEYGKQTVRSFVYNGYVRNVIAGLPDWLFATFIWIVLSAVCGIYATSLWDVHHKKQEESKEISMVASMSTPLKQFIM